MQSPGLWNTFCIISEKNLVFRTKTMETHITTMIEAKEPTESRPMCITDGSYVINQVRNHFCGNICCKGINKCSGVLRHMRKIINVARERISVNTWSSGLHFDAVIETICNSMVSQQTIQCTWKFRCVRNTLLTRTDRWLNEFIYTFSCQ